MRLIVAHCGSLGSFHDIESPQAAKNEMESFDLFMRLFTDPRYRELIHGEISTLVNTHHSMRPVKELLAAPELHDRLLYGSDYPLPAIRMMTSTLLLQQQGLLTPAHRELCNEVFEANPLLFDLVVYRSLRHDTPTGSHRFLGPGVRDGASLRPPPGGHGPR